MKPRKGLVGPHSDLSLPQRLIPKEERERNGGREEGRDGETAWQILREAGGASGEFPYTIRRSISLQIAEVILENRSIKKWNSERNMLHTSYFMCVLLAGGTREEARAPVRAYRVQ